MLQVKLLNLHYLRTPCSMINGNKLLVKLEQQIFHGEITGRMQHNIRQKNKTIHRAILTGMCRRTFNAISAEEIITPQIAKHQRTDASSGGTNSRSAKTKTTILAITLQRR